MPAAVRSSTCVPSSSSPIRMSFESETNRQIFIASRHRQYADRLARARRHGHGVPQRTAVAVEVNHHHIALLELNAVGEAQAVGAVKVHMNIPRTPVRVELEVVMLDVRNTVTHGLFAGNDLAMPYRAALPFDGHSTGYFVEIAVDDELRSQGTVTKLRARQIQVVPLLELVI